MGYFSDLKSVLTGPAEFFQTEAVPRDFGRALKFAVASVLLGGVIKAGGVLAFGQISGLAAGGVSIVFTLLKEIVLAVVVIGISTVIAHVIMMRLGKNGIKKTLSIYLYSTAVAPLVGLISLLVERAISLAGLLIIGSIVKGFLMLVVGALAAIYALYIQIRGLESFHRLETSKATIVGILTFIIMAVVALVLYVILVLVGTLALMRSPSPAPAAPPAS